MRVRRSAQSSVKSTRQSGRRVRMAISIDRRTFTSSSMTSRRSGTFIVGRIGWPGRMLNQAERGYDPCTNLEGMEGSAPRHGGAAPPNSRTLARPHDHVRAAVLLPARFPMAAAERALLTVAHDADAIRGHPQIREILRRRLGAALAQYQVIGFGAALIAVSLDQHRPGRRGTDIVQVSRQRLLTLLGQLPTVIAEESVLEQMLAGRVHRDMLCAHDDIGIRHPVFG